MRADPITTASDEHWTQARALARCGRLDDARIQALWAGVAAYEEGVPRTSMPPAEEDLAARWCDGWDMRASREADPDLPPAAIRLPYAD